MDPEELSGLSKDQLIQRGIASFREEALHVLHWNGAYLGVLGGVSVLGRNHNPKLGKMVTPGHGLAVGSVALASGAAMTAGTFLLDWETIASAAAYGNGAAAIGLMAAGLSMNKQSRLPAAVLTMGVQCMSFALLERNVLSDFDAWKRKARIA